MERQTFRIIMIYLAVFILMLAMINIGVTLLKVSETKNTFTGYQTWGFVNITIYQSIIINLSQDLIDWGPGTIDRGEVNATLFTNGNFTGTAIRGNWSGENATGFVLQNLGNINCSITIRPTKDAHDFFNSSTSTNEQYMLNVTNKYPGSCSGTETLGQWKDVNKTDGTRYCDQFSFMGGQNEVYIDVLLTVPIDSNNPGYQTDSIIITGDAA